MMFKKVFLVLACLALSTTQNHAVMPIVDESTCCLLTPIATCASVYAACRRGHDEGYNNKRRCLPQSLRECGEYGIVASVPACCTGVVGSMMYGGLHRSTGHWDFGPLLFYVTCCAGSFITSLVCCAHRSAYHKGKAQRFKEELEKSKLEKKENKKRIRRPVGMV